MPRTQQEATLFDQYQPLAKSMARKFENCGVDKGNLRQEAFVALLQAVDEYNPQSGRPFGPYAQEIIHNHLVRLVDDSGIISRSWRVSADSKKLQKTQERLSHELGHQPTDEEICEALGWEYRHLLDVRSKTLPMETVQEELEQLVTGNDELIEECIERESEDALKVAISKLPRRQQKVLEMVSEGLSCETIAAELGLSRQRVAQLRDGAIGGLHNTLTVVAA